MSLQIQAMTPDLNRFPSNFVPTRHDAAIEAITKRYDEDEVNWIGKDSGSAGGAAS